MTDVMFFWPDSFNWAHSIPGFLGVLTERTRPLSSSLDPALLRGSSWANQAQHTWIRASRPRHLMERLDWAMIPRGTYALGEISQIPQQVHATGLSPDTRTVGQELSPHLTQCHLPTLARVMPEMWSNVTRAHVPTPSLVCIVFVFSHSAPIDLLYLPTTKRTRNNAKEHVYFILKLHETTKENSEKMNENTELLVVKVRKKLNLNRVIWFGYI